jgi:hypothetical protein
MNRRNFLHLAAICSAAHAFARASTKFFSAEQLGAMATAMLDGDAASRIVTSRALKKLTDVSGRDPWAAGDNYDVDPKAFEQTKKTMLRLQSLGAPETGMNLWLRVPQRDHMVQVVIRLQPGLSSFYNGEMMQDIPSAFLNVFEKGLQVASREKSGLISVLAPVRNSLGEVTALNEIVQRVHGMVPPRNEHKDF